MKYRKDIQGLRAIAVLFVFVFHINATWLPGGFIGVDIFFVISGYLISTIILSKLDNQKFSFVDFYKSRIKRILPAYYVLLIVVATVGIFIFVPSDISAFRKSLFWSVLFNSNNYFASLDTYFGADSSENPLLHTWTLAVEMKFYLFLPLIFFFIKRKWLFKIILLLTLILFAYSSFEILGNNNKNSMYYSLLARTPEFFIGVLTSLILYKKISIPQKWGLSFGLIGMLLLFACGFFINGNSPFPGVLSIIPCIGTAFLIIAPQNPIRTILSHKSLVFIGEISYSLYLWHWPIMAYLRYYYNVIDFSIAQILIIVLLSFTLSVFSYYLIETPLRRIKDYRFAIILMVLTVSNVFAVLFIIPLNKKTTPLPLEFITPTIGLNSHGKTFQRVEIFGDTLTSPNKIFLVGDSHALTMKAYLDYIGKKNFFNFRTISNDRYPPIPMLDKDVFSESRYYNQYLKLLEYVEEEIKNNDIIILQYAGDGRPWVKALENLISNIEPHQSLVVLSDFPFIDKNPVRVNRGIIKDTNRNNIYNITQTYSVNEIQELISSKQNCYFLDLTDSGAFSTAPFYNDSLMYYDNGHLNLYGAIIYAQHTERRFMSLMDSLINM